MDTSGISVKAACYHCGDEVLVENIILEDKSFCCHGCMTVYQLLEKNDLCDYYTLDTNPGNQLSHFFSEKYNYLENEEISDLLLDFKSDQYHKVTFRIPTIHCSSCIWLLENLSKFDAGIISSQINFSRKKLTVNFDPNTTALKAVVDLLCQLGYEPEINLSQKTDSYQKQPITHLIKLGVAGFVFGNIMLLSFPEYLGIDPESLFTNYFSYINLILSLPILIYCASEFYISAFKALSKKILNIDLPITLGIAALFIRSTYEILTSTGAGYLDSLAGLVFFLLIGRWFQSKTYEGLSFDRSYKSYFPLAVTKITQEKRESVLVDQLAVEDILEIRHEEILPCDSVLLSRSAQVDYSFVTGESLPVSIKQGETIFAGGKVKGNAVQVQVKKIVSQGYLTQLWNNPAFEKKESQQTEKLVDKISQYFTPIILTIAVAAGIYWAFVDSSKVLFVISSVLIIACPCALALTTPFTLGTVQNILGINKFYLKNTSVIENFWNVKHLIFDKTGTITYKNSNQITYHGKELSDPECQMVFTLTRNSTHPLSLQINDFLKAHDNNSLIENFEEFKGAGISGIVNGHQTKLGTKEFIGDTGPYKSNGSTAHISIDGVIKGHFNIQNRYREGLEESIIKLSYNYSFTVLSGDNDSELDNLQKLFPPKTNFYFRQSPEDKLNHVKSIQKNTLAAMIGDGLNDAGALGTSEIGISVAENISAFTPASEGIILGKQINKLPAFFKLMRLSKKIIVMGFILSFLYNIVGIGFAISGFITPIFAAILMPLSSITVVAFSTLSIQFLARDIKSQKT